MTMNDVYEISTPDGDIKEIEIDGKTAWECAVDETKAGVTPIIAKPTRGGNASAYQIWGNAPFQEWIPSPEPQIGTNLIDNSKIEIGSAVSNFTYTDTSISYASLSVGTIVNSAEIKTTDTSYAYSWTGNNVSMSVKCYDTSHTYIGEANKLFDENNQAVVTLLSNTVYIRLVITNNIQGNITISNLMLNSGNQVKTFEPFRYLPKTGPCPIQGVGDRTANLAKQFVECYSIGLRLTPLKDGSYNLDGTASGNGGRLSLICSEVELEPGAYTLSTNYDKIYGVCVTDMSDLSAVVINTVKGAFNSFAITSKKTMRIGLNIRSGDIFDNYNFVVMLNSGSEPLPYEPYGYKTTVVDSGKNLCSSFILGKRLDFTDGREYASSNAMCTDYFPVYFNDEFTRIGVNGLPNNVASCCFVYDKDFNFVGRAGNNSKEQISLKPEVFVNGQGTKEYDKIKYMRISISAPSYEGNVMAHYFDVRNSSEEIVPYVPYRPPIETTIYHDEPYFTGDYVRKDNDGGTEYREWGKYVMTGDESMSLDKPINKTIRYYTNTAVLKGCSIPLLTNIICSHFSVMPRNTIDYQAVIACAGVNAGQMVFRVDSVLAPNANEFKAFLKSEYDAGHPVTIYYQLVTPTDTPKDLPEILLVNGYNGIDTDTEIKPEKISVTYLGKDGN